MQVSAIPFTSPGCSATSITALDNACLEGILKRVTSSTDRKAVGLACKLLSAAQDSLINEIDCFWWQLPVVALRFNSLRVLRVFWPAKCCNHSEEFDTVAPMKAIGSSCPMLRELFLDHSGPLDECLGVVADSWPALEVLIVSGNQATKQGVERIIRSCPDLRDLRFRGCWKVAGFGDVQGSSLCLSKLETLQFTATRMPDTRLAEIGHLVPNLKHFTMTGCHKFKGGGLPAFLEGCGASLKSLTVGFLRGYTDSAKHSFASIGQHCKRLKKLVVTTWSCWQGLGNWDDQIAKLVRSCPLLEHLEVDNIISNYGLYHVARSCSNLRRLELRCNDMVTDAGIGEVLLECSALQWLVLEGCCEISDTAVVQLAALQRHLEGISLCHCPVSDAAAMSLGLVSKNLRFCNLAHTGVTDVGLTRLASLCSQLEELNVTGSAVSARGILFAAEKCPRLRSIVAAQIPLQNDFMCQLATYSAQLETLTLSSAMVTDEGLRVLCKHCKNLRSLNLTGCHITARGLEAVPRRCSVHFLEPEQQLLDLGESEPSLSDAKDDARE